jgi:diaminopimelate epimerase
MQGVGNDFVLVDGRAQSRDDWPALAHLMCRRHTGIGADGLLVVDHSDTADILMRMFNPDGTPDVCGNGMRCVARYVTDSRRRTTDDEKRETNSQIAERPNARMPERPALPTTLTLETLAGVRTACVGPESGGTHWSVDMGEPQFDPKQIPMRVDSERVMDFRLAVHGERIPLTALSTGTTHSIVFVDEMPDDEEFIRLSPAIEHHPLFPERTSVMWTQVEDSGGLQIRIWERGAGETWGCGTGSCAAAVAAILHGFVRSPVCVRSKGGELTVEWEAPGPMRLTGPAEYVYTGFWPEE